MGTEHKIKEYMEDEINSEVKDRLEGIEDFESEDMVSGSRIYSLDTLNEVINDGETNESVKVLFENWIKELELRQIDFVMITK